MMKASKRLFAIILSFLIILSVTAVTVNADSEPRFELTKAYGDPGETVQIELKICDNPGITALSVSIGYSADDLELISVDNGGLFETPISLGMLTVNPFTVSWYASDSGNKTDNGTVAVITCRIREGAEDSPITVTYNPENVFDNTLQNKTFATVNGMVGIGEEPIGPPKPYFLGDADGNGELESVDATFIQRCIAQIPTPYTKAELMRGDVDGSGDLELTDVTAIQYYLCHLKTPYPIGETIS